MIVTPIYTALLALIFLVLSRRVISTRRKARVSVGDGGNAELTRAIAVHNNFAQYVPLTLLLLVFMELQHAPAWLLHAMGVSLVLARLVHAFGVSRVPENFRLRTLGMGLTFGTISIASAYILISSILRSI